MQNHPKAILEQMLSLPPEEQDDDKNKAIQDWNEAVSSALSDTTVQALLDTLVYGGVACADLRGISSRACATVQTGGFLSKRLQFMLQVFTACVQCYGTDFATDALLKVDSAPPIPLGCQLSTAVQAAADGFVEASYPVSTVLSDLSGLQKELVQAAEQLRDGAYAISFEVC